jgi:DNA-binding PadR family transcriptional regulator
MKQLAEEGLATSAVERTSGKPDRRVYSITEAGRAELWRWLDKPAEPMRERVEVLLKLFFGCAAPIETSVAHLERTRAEHAALLLEYEGMETHIRAEHGDHPAVGFGLLALRCGIHHSAAYVAWCDEALATLATAPPNPESRIQNQRSPDETCRSGHFRFDEEPLVHREDA